MISQKSPTAFAVGLFCIVGLGLEQSDAAGIQNNESNKTRFYVLSLDAPATVPAERMAFIAMGDAAALPALMAQMQKQEMTLITLHDRPLKTELGQYYYLIECTSS